MKFLKLVVLLGILITGGLGLPACASHKTDHSQEKKEQREIAYYTCPMHPQIHRDHPGECPICHMTLVPVYKEERGQEHQKHQGDSTSLKTSAPSVTISPERQQMIGLTTTTVTLGPVIKMIRTSGRVAFDQELAVALREYLEIVNNVPSLKEAAKSRLKLMGVSDQEIQSLEKRKTSSSNLYLPQKGDSVWVYATLYESEMNLVKIGSEAEISLPYEAGTIFTGTVRAIDPTVDSMTRSVRARIEVPKGGGLLKPDSFVNVSLQVDLGQAMTVPKSAVIDTGMRTLAFVVHRGNHFQSTDIKTGAELEDRIVVLEGLKEGETVVSSATFLVDSESQLKAAVSGGTEHQH